MFVNIVLILILIFTTYDYLKIYNNINTRLILGWCIIILLMLMISFNIIVFSYNLIKSIVHTVKMILDFKNRKNELKIKPI